MMKCTHCLFIFFFFVLFDFSNAQIVSLRSRRDTSHKNIDLSRVYGIETNDSNKIYAGSIVSYDGNYIKFKPKVRDTVYLFKKEHVLRLWYCKEEKKELCGKQRIFSGKIWRYALFFILILFLAALLRNMNWVLAFAGLLGASIGLFIGNYFSSRNVIDLKRKWKFK